MQNKETWLGSKTPNQAFIIYESLKNLVAGNKS